LAGDRYKTLASAITSTSQSRDAPSGIRMDDIAGGDLIRIKLIHHLK
jgi:hypothetical protein